MFVHDTFVINIARLSAWLAAILTPLRAQFVEHAASAPGGEAFARDAGLYLERTFDALQRHLSRLAAGMPVHRPLPKPPTSTGLAVPPGAPPRAAPSGPPPPRRTPRRHGWLVQEVQRAARVRLQLQVFLADPQTQALCAASPRADRLLGRFRHALAIPSGDPWRGATLAARLRRARHRLPDQPGPDAGHPSMTDEELAALGIVRTGRTMRMGSLTLRVPDWLPPWPPPAVKPA